MYVLSKSHSFGLPVSCEWSGESHYHLHLVLMCPNVSSVTTCYFAKERVSDFVTAYKKKKHLSTVALKHTLLEF